MEYDAEITHDEESASMAEAVAAFHAATEPDLPEIEQPRDGIVHLMHGLADSVGERQKKAEVRELTGEDEEILSRLRTTDFNYVVNLTDMIIRRGTLRVGDIDTQADPSVLGDLLVADRDLLFKEIIITTFGEHREFEEIECPTCSAKNDVRLDVEAILNVTELENDDPTFVVELRDGTKLSLHYMTGKDQRQVFDSPKQLTMAEFNTRTIAQCLDEVNGEKAVRKMAYATQMGMEDRRKVLAAMQKGPSVRFKEVEVPCPACESKIPFVFGWADLLPL